MSFINNINNNPIKSQTPPFIVGNLQNNMIHKFEGINSSWKYRQYLQNNANMIMDYNKILVSNEYNNTNFYTNDQNSANIPFLYQSCLERTQPFGYETSDLKEAFLTKQQLQCVKRAPEVHVRK